MVISEATRLASIQEYYFSVKLKQIKELNENGSSIVNIGIGSPDLQPHQDVINVLSQNAQSTNSHGYQNYRGIDDFRSAISAYYKRDYEVALDESQILPLMGSKEGIMQITQAFINEGETVLIPNPGYPTYGSVSSLAKANVLTYNLVEENNFQIDLRELKSMDLDQVKIMWMNFPHMPTGTEPDKEIIQEVIKLAKKHKFLIVNDNPYSRILTKSAFSIFQIEGAGKVALELNSLSKSHNMAGWRIGWMCGRQKYINTVLKVRSNMDSGMFYPLQMAAIRALELGDDWFDQLNQTYSSRRKLVFKLFDLLDCTYNRNQSGLFVWAKIPDEIECVEDLVDDLIFNSDIFITPGKIFGTKGDRYLRAALCSSEEVLQQCINRLIKRKS
jgi:aspartate/methionine/tyrosine aminotransferase